MRKDLQCFPTDVLLKLEVSMHVQITLVIDFPATSTDSNLLLHPFNYICVLYMTVSPPNPALVCAALNLKSTPLCSDGLL